MQVSQMSILRSVQPHEVLLVWDDDPESRKRWHQELEAQPSLQHHSILVSAVRDNKARWRWFQTCCRGHRVALEENNGWDMYGRCRVCELKHDDFDYYYSDDAGSWKKRRNNVIVFMAPEPFSFDERLAGSLHVVVARPSNRCPKKLALSCWILHVLPDAWVDARELSRRHLKSRLPPELVAIVAAFVGYQTSK